MRQIWANWVAAGVAHRHGADGKGWASLGALFGVSFSTARECVLGTTYCDAGGPMYRSAELPGIPVRPLDDATVRALRETWAQWRAEHGRRRAPRGRGLPALAAQYGCCFRTARDLVRGLRRLEAGGPIDA